MSRTTQGIPIEQIDVDKIPQEKPIQYDEIAKLVGSLYIDTHHRINTVNEQAKAFIKTLQDKISGLMEENSRLKEELRREQNNGGSSV